jgi:hypothetical protein
LNIQSQFSHQNTVYHGVFELISSMNLISQTYVNGEQGPQ